jgi:Flp pilus assembly protein TadB
MIMEFPAVTVAAALTTSVAIGAVLVVVLPPPKRLRSRINPYLNHHASLRARGGDGLLGSVFGPIISDIAHRLGSLVDRAGNAATVVRLRQAGWFRGAEETEMINRYRLTQLRSTAAGVAIGFVMTRFIDTTPAVTVVLVALGVVVGVTRTRGRLDRAIEERRETMRIEIYTVNQLLAMRVRAGGGVIQAVKVTTQRGRGEVVSELEEALRLHRAGWPAADSFRRIAELSPEPFCARTYRLLAAAEERGADLASALLALSEDVRESRRESIKRSATRRRAAMLVPTIAILAPVLLLFVAAPLPYLITSWQ